MTFAPGDSMNARSVPLHDDVCRRLNADYAAALQQVAGALASASFVPSHLEFTAVGSDGGVDSALGRVLLSWTVGPRRLRLEFDADGLVDYQCEPDAGPLPLSGSGDGLGALLAWLGDRPAAPPERYRAAV